MDPTVVGNVILIGWFAALRRSTTHREEIRRMVRLFAHG